MRRNTRLVNREEAQNQDRLDKAEARFPTELQRRFSIPIAELPSAGDGEEPPSQQDVKKAVADVVAAMKVDWRPPIVSRLREFDCFAAAAVDLAFCGLPSMLLQESVSKYPDSVFGSVVYAAYAPVLEWQRPKAAAFQATLNGAIEHLDAIYGDFLRGAVASFGDEIAQSAVQHTFLKLAQMIRLAREVRAPTLLPLLISIARNKARDLARKRQTIRRGRDETFVPAENETPATGQYVPPNDPLLAVDPSWNKLAAVIVGVMRDEDPPDESECCEPGPARRRRRKSRLILTEKERGAWLAKNLLLPDPAIREAMKVGQSFQLCLHRANKKLKIAVPLLVARPASTWNRDLGEALRRLETFISGEDLSSDGPFSLGGSRILAGALLAASSRRVRVPYALGLFVARRLDVSSSGSAVLALRVLEVFDDGPSRAALSKAEFAVCRVRASTLLDHVSEEQEDAGKLDKALHLLNEAKARALPFAEASPEIPAGYTAYARYQLGIFERRLCEVELAMALDDPRNRDKKLRQIEARGQKLYNELARARLEMPGELASLSRLQAGNVLLVLADVGEALRRPRSVTLGLIHKAQRIFAELERSQPGSGLIGRRLGYAYRCNAESLFRMLDLAGNGCSTRKREEIQAEAEAELAAAMQIFRTFDDVRQGVRCCRLAQAHGAALLYLGP